MTYLILSSTTTRELKDEERSVDLGFICFIESQQVACVPRCRNLSIID